MRSTDRLLNYILPLSCWFHALQATKAHGLPVCRLAACISPGAGGGRCSRAQNQHCTRWGAAPRPSADSLRRHASAGELPRPATDPLSRARTPSVGGVRDCRVADGWSLVAAWDVRLRRLTAHTRNGRRAITLQHCGSADRHRQRRVTSVPLQGVLRGERLRQARPGHPRPGAHRKAIVREPGHKERSPPILRARAQSEPWCRAVRLTEPVRAHPTGAAVPHTSGLQARGSRRPGQGST